MSHLAQQLLDTARLLAPRLAAAGEIERLAARDTLLAFVARPTPSQFLATHRALVQLAQASALARVESGPTRAHHAHAVEDFIALQQTWTLPDDGAETLRALPAWRGSADALTILRHLGEALVVSEAKIADQLRRARAPRINDTERRTRSRSIVITKSPSSVAPAASATDSVPTPQEQPPRMSTPGPDTGPESGGAASRTKGAKSSTRAKSGGLDKSGSGETVPPKHDETWVSRVSSQDVGVAQDGSDSAPGLPVDPISDSLG